MDIAEARRILAERLTRYRTLSYAQLVARIDQVECEQIGEPGKKFWQMEFQVVWDTQLNGNVRVLGSIDDGGLRAFAPLTDDFIKAPNDEFIDQ
jgi:hypothetical protein